jgi:CheY-like chemotaxis protein
MTKILVIEDNESNRDLISRYLELFDYEVSTAMDGREGLEKVRAERTDIDVILMDMNLPELDGWEVTRRLKADAATRSVPVIALTAHAMVGDREKALRAGCDDYATKPIDFNSLFSKIESLCQKGL